MSNYKLQTRLRRAGKFQTPINNITYYPAWREDLAIAYRLIFGFWPLKLIWNMLFDIGHFMADSDC